MSRLVFATRNTGKLVELRQLVAELGLEVIGVAELERELGRELPDAPEDEPTFAGNAAQKARTCAQASGLAALADDSGLEVEALDGAPGVRSARFAGTHGDDEANNRLLLARLIGVPAARRRARFRCAVALAAANGELVATAEGECAGAILEAPRGSGGFGYDPLFYSDELGATFAEVGVGQKGGFSHRARAMRLLLPALARFSRLQSPPEGGN